MAEPSPPEKQDSEREAFIAAVDDGLADLNAGRVFTHEQVEAEVRKRFPPAKQQLPRSAADS